MQYDNQNNELINLINILSFMVGIENLNENRIQSAHNDVQIANDKQAEYLLREIKQQFEEQNKVLENQNHILGQLLSLLKNEE